MPRQIKKMNNRNNYFIWIRVFVFGFIILLKLFVRLISTFLEARGMIWEQNHNSMYFYHR